MNIFERVRASVTMKQVAELYGIDTKRGMINCIFHDDKTPSMKLYDDHYYCFGCGGHGDAVSFAAQITGLSQYEAAKQLCSAFGIVHSSSEPFIRPTIKRETQREQETSAFRILSDYCKMLREWRERYKPTRPDSGRHPLFIESIMNLEVYENYCSIFISGSQEERNRFLLEGGDILADTKRRMDEAKAIENGLGNVAGVSGELPSISHKSYDAECC